MPALAQIWRHPIKGIGAEDLGEVTLSSGRPMLLDRAFAVLTGTSEDTGEWQPCRNFARGCYAPSLMAVRAETNGEKITLTHPDRDPLIFAPATGDVSALIDWIAPLYPADRPAPRALAVAPDTGMADDPDAGVSVASLASLRALSDAVGQPLDPRRFRINIWLDGDLAPFEELSWAGKSIRIGDVTLRVGERIQRCRATEANPDTGRRDVDTLQALRGHWGHTDFGVLASIETGGTITVGTPIEVSA